MKNFLLKVLLFFALVVVMDFAFGYVFSWLRTHAKGGSTANCEYIANKCEADIIILGSSRATHHYVPHIIEDSLGLSCYNCGEEGNGIVLAYGRFKMLTNRYKPKLIIYEITPGYDYGTKEPNTKYLGYLRPYYGLNGVKSLFDDFDDEFSFLKMKSQMYQNTSKFLPYVVDNIVYRDNNKGYAPLNGTINVEKCNGILDDELKEIDTLKLMYVEKLILDAKHQNIPIVFMISPKFGIDNDPLSYEPEIALCKKFNVPYYSFINYEKLASNAVCFQDIGHMNNDGAIAYTQMIIELLKTPVKDYVRNHK